MHKAPKRQVSGAVFFGGWGSYIFGGCQSERRKGVVLSCFQRFHLTAGFSWFLEVLVTSIHSILKGQNCLQWGRSNLVDPVESPKIRLLNWDFGNILSIFPRKNSKTQSSLNFLESGPRKFTKSDFSGLAPIRRVLKKGYFQILISWFLWM